MSYWSDGKLEPASEEVNADVEDRVELDNHDGHDDGHDDGIDDERDDEHGGDDMGLDEHGLPSRPRAIVWYDQIYAPVATIPGVGNEPIPAPHVSYRAFTPGADSEADVEGGAEDPARSTTDGDLPQLPAIKEDHGRIEDGSEAEYMESLPAARRRVKELKVLLEKEREIRLLLENVASLTAENHELKAEAAAMEESFGKIHARILHEDEKRLVRKRA